VDWAVELSQDNAHEKKIWVTILGHPDFFLMHVVSSTNRQTSPAGMYVLVPHNFAAAVDIIHHLLCCS